VQKIATYSAEGRRIRDYSLPALRRLAGQRKVYFSYGSRGRLLRATFLPHDGSKLLRTAHVGQSYSYPERLTGTTLHAWCHLPFFALRDDAGQPLDVIESELFVRAVFRAVPLSCLRRPDPPPSPKVVSITTGSRPVRAVSRDRQAA
jgi:hypothetical protein